MKTNHQATEDLTHIREIMEKSSRFLSLSGLSGILAGVYALTGAGAAYWLLNQRSDLPHWKRIHPNNPELVLQLGIVGGLVLFLAISTGYWLSRRRAKQLNVPFYSTTAKRMLINLIVPLATGGIFVVIITLQGYYGLSAPLMLIFYGLSLVNASKYTLHDIRSLGFAQILLGLFNAGFIGYGLYFWACGFGLLHIAYGIGMYYKYER